MKLHVLAFILIVPAMSLLLAADGDAQQPVQTQATLFVPDAPPGFSAEHRPGLPDMQAWILRSADGSKEDIIVLHPSFVSAETLYRAIKALTEHRSRFSEPTKDELLAVSSAGSAVAVEVDAKARSALQPVLAQLRSGARRQLPAFGSGRAVLLNLPPRSP